MTFDWTEAVETLEKRFQALSGSLDFEVSNRVEAVEQLGSEIQTLRLSFGHSTPRQPLLNHPGRQRDGFDGGGGAAQRSEGCAQDFSPAMVAIEEAPAAASDALGANAVSIMNLLRAELAQDMQIREAALSRVMEAISLETNARVAKGAELRRELHAMVGQYGEQIKPIDKLEQSLQDALKEVSKLWHALDVHTHGINVDVAGNLCARQLARTPALASRQVCLASPTSSYLPQRILPELPSRVEVSPQRISCAVPPPIIMSHTPQVVTDTVRVVSRSTSYPHLGLAQNQVASVGVGLASPPVRQISTPQMLVRRARSGSPPADVDAQSVITTKTILPATAQPIVADVDVEGLARMITATCGAAQYVLEPD